MKTRAQAMQLLLILDGEAPRTQRTRSYLPYLCGCFLTGLLMIAGCGSPGAPQPPSLKLPSPPADLSAARSGDTVSLHWTMPRRAVDRVPLSGDQQAVICRGLAAAPCVPVGTVLLQPGAAGSYIDVLPPALRAEGFQLLTYTVLLQNRRGRCAGPSNAAYTAAGAAPQAITGLVAKAGPRGVELRWQKVSSTLSVPASPTLLIDQLVRLHRTRLSSPEAGRAKTKPASGTESAGVPQPVEQVLELAEPTKGASPEAESLGSLDHAVDRNAPLNQTYRYTAEWVERLKIEGHMLEVTSLAGQAVTVDARDLFPPAAPERLDAVADIEGGAIDLSWAANAEPDLAGYYVYRRVAAGAAPTVRVSGDAPIPNPGWRDTRAEPGVRYAYSVSAVDRSGNESAKSAEAEESITAMPSKPAASQPAPSHRP